MKVGILTFHASHNYGSMLQAWALQTYLRQFGNDVEIVNLRTKKQNRLYRHPLSVKLPYRRYDAIECVQSLFNPIWLYRECRKWHKYEDFLQKELTLSSKCYRSWEEIREDLNEIGYDALITGGDQIWNVRCKDFDKSFFLPDSIEGIKKYSYSPSFGGRLLSVLNEEERQFIKTRLLDYDRISVREESMMSFLSDLLDVNVVQAVDPTLLLQASDYDRIMAEEPIVKGEYIFFYSPVRRPYAEELAKQLGMYYGMKVVTTSPTVFNNKGFYCMQESGPSEFLNLLRNATCVVGRSFHSVVFSLLFHKDFIAIDGEDDDRMNSILTQCDILDRGKVTIDNYKEMHLKSIDYEKIDLIIDKHRKSSQFFLASLS